MQLFDYTADEAKQLPLDQMIPRDLFPFVIYISHTIDTLRNSILFDYTSNPYLQRSTLADIDNVWKIITLVRCEVQARVEFLRGGSPDWIGRKGALVRQHGIPW